MNYLLIVHLSLSISWGALAIDDFDDDTIDYEYSASGQRSTLHFGGIRSVKK